MVNQKFARIIGITVIAAQLSGCGLIHNIWGEKAPPRKMVTETGSQMPAATDMFSDDNEKAVSVYEQYRKMALDTFDEIKGQKPNFLSLAEIDTLGRAGLAKLSDNPDQNIQRIHSIITVLGFKNGISRDQVVALLNWLRDNRLQAKAFYDILLSNNPNKKIDTSNIMPMVRFVGSLIALGGGESTTKTDLATIIQPWIPTNYTHAIKALPSGIDIVLGFFGSLCGDRVEADAWNAKKNGECLLSLIDHFQSAAPVFDLIFNNLNPMTETGTLAAANATLKSSVSSWIDGHNHPPFQTQLIATFSEQLDVPAPYHFFEMAAWLPQLNHASTATAFSPTFFEDIAGLIQTWVDTFIEVTATTKEGPYCSFKDWKKCEFTGDYDTANRLFNDEYATTIRTKNLGYVSKIAFYDSVADYLIKSLDDNGDGLLKDDIKNLITVVIQLLDTNAFAQNVIARIQEKPVEMTNTKASLNPIDKKGLAEVAALAADLIPDRGGNKRTILKKLTSQVYDADKYPSYTLDRLGITTFIYVFDLLGSLRNQYMNDYDMQPVVEGTNTYIKRRKIVEMLPRMLYDHFPRIYNECLDWGFERTCGVVYTEVLASAEKGTDVLEPSDMDVISITSILLESMMNRCDRNHDDKLSTNFFDGFDEKHCVLTVSQNLVTRLMRSNIMENDKTTQVLLNVMKWLPPARWAAKVALERGTLKGIGFRAIPVISLVQPPAKLGSVMSVAAELMDPKKVDAIEAGVMGHHEDFGDELIYLHQLTDQYLPSQKWALRTSAAARILYGPALVTPHNP